MQPAETVTVAEGTTLLALDPVPLTTPPDVGQGEVVIPLYPVDVAAAEPVEAPLVAEPPAYPFSMTRLAILGLAVWACGAAISLTLSAWLWQACLRAARRNRGEGIVELEQRVQLLARRLGLRRSVRVIVTKGRLGPAVTGIFRPALLLPEGMLRGKTLDEIEPLLAHELIHIRRGDLWAGLLQTAVLALWWFHPLVRWAVRQTMREAERCCDEAVVAELGCRPKEYARGLLDVLQYKTDWVPAPAFPGAGRIDATARRLERIMGLGQGSRRRSPWWCWLVMLVAGAVVLPGGAFVVSAEKIEGAAVPPTLAEPVAPLPRMAPVEASLVSAEEVGEATPLPAPGRPVAPASVREQIERELALIEKHELTQVAIEVVCIEGKPSAIGTIAGQLEIVPSAEFGSDSSEAWQPAIVEDDLGDITRRVQKHEDTRVLASPHLITVSGRPASIQIGSEVPYGVQDSRTKVGLRFVNVGLEMRFVPYLLANDMVRLDYDAKDSRLEPSNAAEDEGKPRQAVHLTTRHVSAGVEVPLGKVMAIQTPTWRGKGPMKTLLLIRVDSSSSELAMTATQADAQRAWERLGLRFGAIEEEEFQRRFNSRYRGGLEITEIRPYSPAAQEGLRVGDVLVGLHMWETKSAKDLAYVLQRHDLDEFSPLKFYVLRDGEVLYGHLQLAEKPEAPDQPQSKQELYLVAYNVADLVVPVSNVLLDSLKPMPPLAPNPAAAPAFLPPPPSPRVQPPSTTVSDFDSLIELITSVVAPTTWEDADGPGSIAPFEENLSLIIRQTEEVHEEIVDLLEQLRRMQGIRSVLRMRGVEVSDDFCERHWPEMSDEKRAVVMDPNATKKVLDDLRSQGAGDISQVLNGPEVALLNGQQADLSTASLFRRTTANSRILLQAVVSNDRRSVRLTAVTFPDAASHAQQPTTHQVANVGSGDTLALELTGPSGADKLSCRSFVLVTPKVIVAEEEEMRPGVAKRRSELK
jgi:beta-lactamase regulating signal transducer with metallopeptidase domain